ncbi:MAG TPA: flagellar hook-length control protein FliK [Pseudomonadales bacterium]|nr:flagellar hook-length control protein FliK [Pseudomonadales bacterium]
MNLPTIDLSTMPAVQATAQSTVMISSESPNAAPTGDGRSATADFQALMAALQGQLGPMNAAGATQSGAMTTKQGTVQPQQPSSEPLLTLVEETLTEATAGGTVASEENMQPAQSDKEPSGDGLSLPFIGTLLPPTTPLTTTALAVERQANENEASTATDPASLLRFESGMQKTSEPTHSSGLLSETSQSGAERQFMDELKNLLAMMPGAGHEDPAPTADAQAVTPLAQSIGSASPDGTANLTGTAMTSLAPPFLHNSPGDTAMTGKAELPPARLLMEQPLNLDGDTWVDGFAERILWASKNQFHYAEIQLDPPELGALQVRIQIHQDQAQVQFISPHHQVREAIEGSLDRLRDLFQQQGMQLAHSQVDDGGGRGSAQQESRREGWHPIAGENPATTEEPMLQSRPLREGALIDRYA